MAAAGDDQQPQRYDNNETKFITTPSRRYDNSDTTFTTTHAQRPSDEYTTEYKFVTMNVSYDRFDSLSRKQRNKSMRAIHGNTPRTFQVHDVLQIQG